MNLGYRCPREDNITGAYKQNVLPLNGMTKAACAAVAAASKPASMFLISVFAYQ